MSNVLIVDDSRTSRRILRVIVEDMGNTVVGEAVNGEIVRVAVLNAIKKIDDDYLELLKLLYFENTVQPISGEG